MYTIGDFHVKQLSNCDSYDNWSSEKYSLLKKQTKFFQYLYYTSVQSGKCSVHKHPHNLLNDCVFCENQNSESHPKLLSTMGEIRHKMSAHNAAQQLWEFRESHPQLLSAMGEIRHKMSAHNAAEQLWKFCENTHTGGHGFTCKCK
jgi:hypothetical protein